MSPSLGAFSLLDKPKSVVPILASSHKTTILQILYVRLSWHTPNRVEARGYHDICHERECSAQTKPTKMPCVKSFQRWILNQPSWKCSPENQTHFAHIGLLWRWNPIYTPYTPIYPNEVLSHIPHGPFRELCSLGKNGQSRDYIQKKKKIFVSTLLTQELVSEAGLVYWVPDLLPILKA